MIKHYIILGSAYSIGKRIALHYYGTDLSMDKIKKDLESICQVCGEDVSISTHYVQTEAESWSSVIRLDKFFENVKVVSDLNDYIELLKRDRNLIGLDIAKYILTKISCTHLKLEKLTYLCYADYLCQEGEKLFDDNIYAYKLGPVVETVYKKYKKHGKNHLEEDNTYVYTDGKVLPIRSRILASKNGVNKLKSIDKTLDKYGNLEASDLVQLTHEPMSPWSYSGSGKSNQQEIEDSIILNYHKNEELV